MHRFGRLFISLAAVLSVLGGALPAHAEKTIPKAPYYYVLDEPHVLSPQSARALETLLIEHDRLTGEQVLVAIFNSLDGEEPVDFTNRVFSAWKIGQRGKDNGVLLALYWKEHKARIEVGYGLEPELTDAKSKLIISNFLVPELQNNHPDRALSLSALEILRTLGSPLIQDGKAAQILRSGGFIGSFTVQAPLAQAGSVGLWPWLVFGLILLSLAMNFLHAAEAHFTRAGWYKPRPWEFYRIKSGPGAGGSGFYWGGFGGGPSGGGFGGFGGGGGGGFGGFMGGGGSSGGGGATGSW